MDYVMLGSTHRLCCPLALAWDGAVMVCHIDNMFIFLDLLTVSFLFPPTVCTPAFSLYPFHLPPSVHPLAWIWSRIQFLIISYFSSICPLDSHPLSRLNISKFWQFLYYHIYISRSEIPPMIQNLKSTILLNITIWMSNSHNKIN